MVDFLQMGILLLIPLMANKRCLNSSPRTPPISRGGTGFAIRPRIGNANKKGRIEERQSRSLETQETSNATRTLHNYYGRAGEGAASNSEARCLGRTQDQVKH